MWTLDFFTRKTEKQFQASYAQMLRAVGAARCAARLLILCMRAFRRNAPTTIYFRDSHD